MINPKFKTITKFVLLSLLFNSILGCNKNSSDKENIKHHQNFEKNYSLNIDDTNYSSLVGAKLDEYPDGEALYELIGEQKFHEMKNNSPTYIQEVPLYEIEYDIEKLQQVLDLLLNQYGTYDRIIDEKSNSIYDNKNTIVRYTTEDQKFIEVNYNTATIFFVDTQKHYRSTVEVTDLVDEQVLEHAQKYYEQFFNSKTLATSYFFKYDYLINSISQIDGVPDDKIGAVTTMINRVVNDLPIIGNGNPARLTLLPNGELTGFYIQFVNYNPTQEMISLFSKEEALNKLRRKLELMGISMDDHHIVSSELGYHHASNEVDTKWLVPTYQFVISPNNGTTDKLREVLFVASNDNAAHTAENMNNLRIDAYEEKEYDLNNIVNTNYRKQ